MRGWCSITWLFWRTERFPFAPADSRIAPMLAAMPMQVVATSQRRNRIVSMMPNPALTDPPGELM